MQPTFVSLLPGVPIYSEGEFPEALDFLHLSADEHSGAGESALWGAANPVARRRKDPSPARSRCCAMPTANGRQLLGPTTEPEGRNPFTTEPGEAGPSNGRENETASSIAAEPPSGGGISEESAWLALESRLRLL